MTPLRLQRESLTSKIFSSKIVFFFAFLKTNTTYINCKHCKPDLNHLNWRIIHVCTQRLNYDKDHSNVDHHHGFKPFEISRLSHVAIATSCFRHDSICARTMRWNGTLIKKTKWRTIIENLTRLSKAVKGFILTLVQGILHSFVYCVTCLQIF